MMKRWFLLAGLAAAMSGCAKSNHDFYPDGWPAIAEDGKACTAIAGLYKTIGTSQNPDRPTAKLENFLEGKRTLGPGMRRYSDRPDAIRLQLLPDGKVLAEGLEYQDATPRLLWSTTWEHGEAGYQCDENGMRVPDGPLMGVAGYNSTYRVLAKATDGSLIVRQTTNMIGVWVFPPVPMATNTTIWARFEAFN